MALTSAAPYLALLSEHDDNLKCYALTSLNEVVDQLWAEIANYITEIEELYENEAFEKRQLAALVASKVYYNLGDFDLSVKFSLVSGNEFDIEEKSEYIETIVSKCINRYIELSQQRVSDASVVIDGQLTTIFERMLEKCVKSNELKLALGISLESHRLDIVEAILNTERSGEETINLVNYVLACSNNVIKSTTFRHKVLYRLVSILSSLEQPDYFIIFKIMVQLNDSTLAIELFKSLFESSLENSRLIAFQVAFDLVNSASQELLNNTIEALTNDASFVKERDQLKLLKILSGIPTCDLDITFLHNNNNTDISILNKTKSLLDGRNSIFHSAVTFENAFMHAGTTDDSFFRKNLEWLGKATNWSKFSATAALGVIHKGNLSQGRNILQPYLPESSGASHTKGGSLFALGLIFAGHGREIIDYLRKNIVDNANSVEHDVILHGASLGVGVAAMGSNNLEIYEELKNILATDSAVPGQAAGLAMGLTMAGSGNMEAISYMLVYAQETQHETIIRGLAIGIALLNYGKEDEAKPVIDVLMKQENPILRYGGAYTLALAYAGTGDNSAIKQLLHFAVSDPSDDVRRASVLALGFILIRDYTTVPQIVELLSESHNPHVRYGTAMALGISCAGRGLPAAIEVLEPLTRDPVDFVRQGALIAMAMILIQQNEKTVPKVKEIRALFASTIKNKNQDALAKFGASLAQGIIDAGGRNVTIQLENPQTNTINMNAIIGLALFTQSWYWFPLTHFLSLSFTPTSIIGIKDDLKIPKFELNCHTKSDLFEYPEKVEEAKEKQPDKLATAVLSTTAKTQARLKKSKAKKEEKEEKEVIEEDKMEIDETTKVKEESIIAAVSTPGEVSDAAEEGSTTRYSKTPYKIVNMTRVVPAQSKYISFIKDQRFVPVRKFKGNIGVVVLRDTKPEEEAEYIKTVRQLNATDAPVPEPFTLEEEDDE